MPLASILPIYTVTILFHRQLRNPKPVDCQIALCKADAVRQVRLVGFDHRQNQLKQIFRRRQFQLFRADLVPASQLLLVPQIVLAMVSTGFAPLAAFPQWLHPFVRYQPVSPLTETLRALTTGRPDTPDLALTLAWCLGLLVVFGTVAVRMQRRAG